MNKWLSLIIPVYNVEQYIEECISSISCQITPEIEVIIVNDGTSDCSMELVNEIINRASEDIKKCFIILNQENQGQSAARNNAVKIAKGKYIGFIDSDDYIHDKYIQKIMSKLLSHKDLDVLSFCGRVFNEEKVLKKIVNEKIPVGIFYKNYSFTEENFSNCEWMCWTRVVRRELLIDHPFPVGYILEDMYVFINIYLTNIRIMHIDDILYFYRQHSGSATNKKELNYYDSFEYLLNYYKKRLKESNNVEHIKLFKITYYKIIYSYVYELSYKKDLKWGFNRIKSLDLKDSVKYYSIFLYFCVRVKFKKLLFKLRYFK